MYTWANNSRGHILINRVLATPNYVKTYTKYMQMLLDTYFQPNAELQQRIFSIRDFIAPSVYRDLWYGMDLAYTHTEFYTNYNHTVAHPTNFPNYVFGVLPFLQLRYSTLRQQIHT
jgi:hypothetical protein